MSKEEFWDVYRYFRPEDTREDFDREWQKFLEAKQAEQRRKEIQ